MKKLFKYSTLLSIPFMIAACGGEEGADSNTEGNGELLVMLSEEPAEDDALTTALNKWADETDNRLELLVVPYDDQIASFRSMIQNDDAPDLVSTTRLTRLYPEEFYDLSNTVDRSIFDPTALEVIAQDDQIDSRILVTPNQYTFSLWYYNADAFEEAGIEPPTEESIWTVDEVYENAERLYDSGAVKYGLAVDFSRARYDNFMYSDGGSITAKSDEGDILVNANDPVNVSVLEEFTEVNNSDYTPGVIWTGGSADNPGDYFQNGDVGIYLSGTWNYDSFSKNVDSFEFCVMPSPTGEVQRSVIPGGAGLAVPEASKNREMAEDFIAWLYEEDNYKEFIQNDKGVSFLEGIEIEREDEKTEADFEIIQNEMTHVTDEFLMDHESRWTNYLDNEYRDYLRRAVAGELTAEEALNGFADDLSETAEWDIKE